MIAFIGVAAAIFVVAAVVGIFYFAGNRGRKQQVEERTAAAKGHGQFEAANHSVRSEGRGDL